MTKTISELASIDGQIAPTHESSLPLPDDGLFRGDGVFEVVRIYAGQPFALVDHLDRIERSADAIELPVDRPAIESELADLLERLGDADCQVRIVLTRGGRRLVLSEPLPTWNETLTVATVRYAPSVILTGVKSISYAANMEATRIAKGAGAEEAILVRPDGIVLEAPTSTLFWATADGTLKTPALACGILNSITRARVLAELEVEEGEYPLEDLLGAREAFLASTTREVQGISSVDGTQLPEAPGARTREAADAFARRRDAELGAEARP
jgi:branched-chain amino acid aminotransferase